jgi:hypothetical protein
MVLAIAALFLQLAPAAHVFADVNATIPLVKPATADATTGAAKPAALASTTDAATGNAVPTAFTLAKLEGTAPQGQALETIRVPDPTPSKPVKIFMAETHPRKAWLILSIAEHSAATFDAYSTRVAVSKGATEADPMMRPFAHSPAIYGAIQVCPLVLDYAARRMERSQFSLLRKTWWVPQTAATGIFLFSGVHNMGVANSMH